MATVASPQLQTQVLNPAANLRQIQAPSQEAVIEGFKLGFGMPEKIRERSEAAALQKKLKEVGAQALQGQMDAITDLALMPGGAKLAETLQTIAKTRTEDEIRQTQKYLSENARFLAGLMTEPEKFVRQELTKKAFAEKEAGNSDAGNELMRIAQLPDFNEIKSEMRQDIMLAVPAEDFLKSYLGGSDELKRIRSDTSKRVAGNVQKIVDKAVALQTNYKKVELLAEDVRTKDGKPGNRSSVAPLLIAMVKLFEPNSAVLQAEMDAALNQKGPLAALADIKTLITEKASSAAMQALAAKIDPLNPENVNADDILQTARLGVASQIPSIEQEFNLSFGQSKFLSPEDQESIFTPELGQMLYGLQALAGKAPGRATEPVMNGVPISQIKSTDQVDVEAFKKLPKPQQQKIIDQIKAASGG